MAKGLGIPLPVSGANLPIVQPASVEMDGGRLDGIEDLVERGIRRGDHPGAVILIGRHRRIALLRAYGDRRVLSG